MSPFPDGADPALPRTANWQLSQVRRQFTTFVQYECLPSHAGIYLFGNACSLFTHIRSLLDGIYFDDLRTDIGLEFRQKQIGVA